MEQLETLFTAARRTGPDPSADLLARVMQDALAVQAEAGHPKGSAAPRGRLAQLRDAIGGWPAMGGLVTATAAGIWIGISPPDPIETLTAGLLDRPAQALWIDTDTVLAMGLGEEMM